MIDKDVARLGKMVVGLAKDLSDHANFVRELTEQHKDIALSHAELRLQFRSLEALLVEKGLINTDEIVELLKQIRENTEKSADILEFPKIPSSD